MDQQQQVVVWVGPESVGAERDFFRAELAIWKDRPIIRFSAPHARGATAYEVHLHPDNFAAVAELMLKTNPDTAIKAFGQALSKGLPKVVE